MGITGKVIPEQPIDLGRYGWLPSGGRPFTVGGTEGCLWVRLPHQWLKLSIMNTKESTKAMLVNLLGMVESQDNLLKWDGCPEPTRIAQSRTYCSAWYNALWYAGVDKDPVQMAKNIICSANPIEKIKLYIGILERDIMEEEIKMPSVF